MKTAKIDGVRVIGIAGGSGSGKTTFAKRLIEAIGQDNCALVAQDHYYRDQSNKFDFDGGSVNFDHPSALDFALMARHLKDLRQGKTIESPRYCFATHTRKKETFQVFPKKIVVVDGILIFSQPEVLENLDHKIFIDCEEELRFQRRLKRDTEQRGREEEGVRAQFFNQVKPMHDQFVEPSKELACDVVSPLNFHDKSDYWSKLVIESCFK
ncbi:MAG: uridine kinase [Bacteriovoracaceae bacterium]